MSITKSQVSKSTIRFNAKVESKTLLTLPKTVSAKLSLKGEVIVEGAMGSIPFKTSVVSDSKGNHFLKVNKDMYITGDEVRVEITRVGDEVETRMLLELRKALAIHSKAKAQWALTTMLARRDWIFWMITGKLEETRKIRVDKAMDMLEKGKKRVCCFPGVKWLMEKGG